MKHRRIQSFVLTLQQLWSDVHIIWQEFSGADPIGTRIITAALPSEPPKSRAARLGQ